MVPKTSVELRPHDPTWQQSAVREAERMRAAIGEALVAVHHIGSTAIPGILAKPILDLIPEFRSLAELEAARGGFEALGYHWRGEYGLPGRRYCTLSEPASGRRLVHAHCYTTANTEIDRHLAFRNYLCAHPEIASQYEAEKLRCRAMHPENSAAYSEAKHAGIQAVQREALNEWRSR